MNQSDIELFKGYDDDELVNNGKMNSIKSVAPMFIYKILQQHSTQYRLLTNQDIIDLLDNPPYSIVMERKAVARSLKTLSETGWGITVTRRGSYYNPSDDIWAA